MTTTDADRERALELWHAMRNHTDQVSVLAEALAATRAEALECAMQWHEAEIVSLDGVDARALGLTKYGKDKRLWHTLARDHFRALIATPAETEKK